MAKPVKVVVLGDAKDAKKAFADIRKEADDTQSHFRGVGSKLGSGLLTGIGAVAAGVGAIGVAAAGLFAKGFMDGIEAERLTDMLSARLDLTEGEAESAGRLASELYRDAWGESLADVNDAIGAVVTNLDGELLGTSRDITKTMVEDALTIADVWDQDVNEVIRSAAALMDSGLAQSAEEAFDIITSGLTEGADLNGDFLDTLFEYSTFFEAAGFSAERMLSGLIAGTDAGMMGVDKVGDAVKEMGLIIQAEGEASQDALKELGFDADAIADAFAKGGDFAGEASQDIIRALADVEDPLEQTQLAIALMGVPFEDLGTAGPRVLEELAEGTLELRDTADVASEAYDNTATSIEEFKRRGWGALQDFVGAALGAFGVGGEDGSLKSGIDDLNSWIAENEEQIKEWGVEFAEAAQQAWQDLQPLLEVLGDVAEWFADSDNLDRVKEWATNIETWAGIAEAAVMPLWNILQTINDLLRDNESRSTAMGSGTRGGPGKASGKSGGGGGSGLQFFSEGGWVEGPLNSAQLAVVHGGEYVVPVGGTVPGTVVNVHVAGSVMTDRDLAQVVREELIRNERRNGQRAIR